MLFDIKEKNAVITGASRGIGLALAEGYAKAGANLILIARNMAEADLARLRGYGVRAESYPYDLSEPEGIPALVSTILTEWKRVDILVNNAGAQRRNNSVDFTDEDWDFVNNVNAKSVFILCREFGRHMIAQGGGKIINVASMLSFQGGVFVPGYAASKGGIKSLTMLMANELAPHKICTNAIAPGYIATENTRPIRENPARNQSILDRIPAGRWGTPEDLMAAVVFLASPASDYMNGHTLAVDGGWLAR